MIAYRVWREKKRIYLVNKYIPKIQALFRMLKPYRGLKEYRYHVTRHRKAIKIQTFFRMVVRIRNIKREIAARRLLKKKNRCAILIQKSYWGLVGKKKVKMARIARANMDLRAAKIQAVKEVKATMIQCFYYWYVAKCRVADMKEARRKRIERLKLELRSCKFMQRVSRGFIGRRRAFWKREELRLAKLRWDSALFLERVYRGHRGRAKARHERYLRWLRLINKSATIIQCKWRMYRSKCLVGLLRALRDLRRAQKNAITLVQRITRGIQGRVKAARIKMEKEKAFRERWASTRIQKLFRGHKGREVAEIEKALRDLESKARPLFAKVKALEEDGVIAKKKVDRLESLTLHSEAEIVAIVEELDRAKISTHKLTDSSRINGIPQRFLTKYLIVRLEDHLVNEKVDPRIC